MSAQYLAKLCGRCCCAKTDDDEVDKNINITIRNTCCLHTTTNTYLDVEDIQQAPTRKLLQRLASRLSFRKRATAVKNIENSQGSCKGVVRQTSTESITQTDSIENAHTQICCARNEQAIPG